MVCSAWKNLALQDLTMMPLSRLDERWRVSMSIGIGIAIGVGIGAALLAATGDAFWIAVGAGVGVAMGAAIGEAKRRRR